VRRREILAVEVVGKKRLGVIGVGQVQAVPGFIEGIENDVF
jgi:hypothetical protein